MKWSVASAALLNVSWDPVCFLCFFLYSVCIHLENVNIHSHNHILHFNNKSRSKYSSLAVVEKTIWRREKGSYMFTHIQACMHTHKYPHAHSHMRTHTYTRARTVERNEGWGHKSVISDPICVQWVNPIPLPLFRWCHCSTWRWPRWCQLWRSSVSWLTQGSTVSFTSAATGLRRTTIATSSPTTYPLTTRQRSACLLTLSCTRCSSADQKFAAWFWISAENREFFGAFIKWGICLHELTLHAGDFLCACVCVTEREMGVACEWVSFRNNRYKLHCLFHLLALNRETEKMEQEK